ncbi:MAG: hypothetical protein ACREMI_12235 [Gemmatimonadales bacterium]
MKTSSLLPANASSSSVLLVLSEDRIAREVERWRQIDAGEARWHRELRRRQLLLGLRGAATYVLGGLLAWGSLGMTGEWAQIAFWGGLLLSNAGPVAFGYAFWMRESGLWN